MTHGPKRIMHNVHIYLFEKVWYIPTVVKRPNGFWVEMEPVQTVLQGNKQDLAAAIFEAQQASVKVQSAERGWDGDAGKIWGLAVFNCHIYWWSNGQVKMAPQHRIPGVVDLETGQQRQGEWRAIKEDEVIFPSNTQHETLVERLYLFAEGFL